MTYEKTVTGSYSCFLNCKPHDMKPACLCVKTRLLSLFSWLMFTSCGVFLCLLQSVKKPRASPLGICPCYSFLGLILNKFLAYEDLIPVVKISSGVTSSITEERSERFLPSPTATCNANPAPNGALTSQKTVATFPAVHSQSVFVYPECSHYQRFVVYDKWQPFSAGCKEACDTLLLPSFATKGKAFP